MCPKCLSIQSVQVSKVSKCPKYPSIPASKIQAVMSIYKFQCPVFISMIHYRNGKVIQIRTESGNVSRSISSGIMEMENLHGLGKIGNVSRSITFGNFQV